MKNEQYFHIDSLQAEDHPGMVKRFGACVVKHGPTPYGVRMFQNKNKKQSFTVVYFLDVKTKISYDEAATAYGSAVMHYQSCEGSIDNERD